MCMATLQLNDIFNFHDFSLDKKLRRYSQFEKSIINKRERQKKKDINCFVKRENPNRDYQISEN